MSIFDNFTQIFGNPLGTMAFTTPDSLVGQAGILGGSAYLGGQGLMGLDSGASDPFSLASGQQLTADFGGTPTAGGIFGETGLPGVPGLPGVSDLYNIAQNLGILKGGSGSNSLLPSSVTKDPNLFLRTLPGAMALGYAASQPSLDLGQLNNISGELQGNQNAVVQAATDPLQRNIAAGYGDLLQSQALRGIRGSSFGDTDIGNYIANTGNALANAGANAMQGSLGLQSDLATNIAALQNQRQQMKNQLYGTAFDVLGRGLNPQGYAANLGGYQIPQPGTPQPQPNKLNALGSLVNAGSSLIGDIGSALGSIF